MKELEYPFDNGFIMKKKRSLKKAAFGRRSGAAEKEGGCAGRLDYGRYRVGIGAVFA